MNTFRTGGRGLVDIKIRRFDIVDYQNIISLWEKVGLTYRPEGRDSPDSIKKQVDKGTSIIIIAEVEGRIIGSVLGTHDGRKGWINRLAVDPEFRRKHVATRLVKELETIFEKLGLEVIACLIETNNTLSREAFKKLGYEYYGVEYYSKRKSLKS
jgi:ribosomal protein S18 acetylase RimI-like enzyme